MINWNATREESAMISKIADKAIDLCGGGNKMAVIMDLEAIHCNGCRLDLQSLMEFDDFNLLHDVCGISAHIDRSTGQLTDCFVPRSAAKC